jgi:hypothetical protein
MSSFDAGVNVSGPDGSISQAMTPPRRQRLGVGALLGGFLLTGAFLVISAAAFPLAAVFSFIWWAQHY